MTTYDLGPTQLYAPSERLLHGKGVECAIGAGEAEDWIRLDRRVHWATCSNVFRSGKSTSWIRVGFRSVNTREIADWRRAPYWQEGLGGTAAPSWSLPPTESEIALCLCHGDPRVRAAALALDESAELPVSVLPLVLIRSADTDERVRTLARAVLDRVLGDFDKALPRQLASLAVLVGMRRRYGSWAREAVLGRLGALPDETLTYLLTNGRESRLAGLEAATMYGLPAMEQAWALAEQDRDEGVRALGVRTAIRLALASGQQAVLDDARVRFFAHLDNDCAYGLRLNTFATAVEAGFLHVDDLATLAATHRYRKIRRHACAAVLAHPEGDVVLDLLLSARDTFVRSAAVGRLRHAGRGDELPRYLADLSGGVRATACRELRTEGYDLRAHYQALCADPATVVPTAVLGLAEQGHPEDAALLHSLLRHPHATVRARALSALRMLGALPDDALPPFADDPDPGVRGTALSALRGTPCLLRDLLDSSREDVRARAEVLLERNRIYRQGACRCCPSPPPTAKRSRWARLLAEPRPDPWQPSLTRPTSYGAGAGDSLPPWLRPTR
ncbi:HEAT repeat domain-containing protein [Streptomyces sp. NPDC057239]|uniref:HEAT repeat domain-containing protein n=1 Tax=Streptomyces sp. NPDC057239 TaxID=3346061 RepID=UPI003642E09E